jgi:Holliday junction resolvasome RuvABC endonuclease subunit
MSKIMGLDLSLTGTGMVVLDNGSIMSKKLIKTKPTEKTYIAEINRLLHIKAEIVSEIERVVPDLVLIEGMAFAVRQTTAVMQLAGLNYMIREYLAIKKIPFIICAPSSLKKFILGKGVGPKDVMMLEVYKTFGVSFLDPDTCDAFALAQCGVAVLGESKRKLTKPQEEVKSLLTPQYEETRIA